MFKILSILLLISTSTFAESSEYCRYKSEDPKLKCAITVFFGEDPGGSGIDWKAFNKVNDYLKKTKKVQSWEVGEKMPEGGNKICVSFADDKNIDEVAKDLKKLIPAIPIKQGQWLHYQVNICKQGQAYHSNWKYQKK